MMKKYNTLFFFNGKLVASEFCKAYSLEEARDEAEWAMTVKYPNVAWDEYDTWEVI